MKKEKNIFGIDNKSIVIDPNFPKFNLETPELKEHLAKVSQLLKNVKLPFSSVS